MNILSIIKIQNITFIVSYLGAKSIQIIKPIKQYSKIDRVYNSAKSISKWIKALQDQL